jgi:hypothetical protein
MKELNLIIKKEKKFHSEYFFQYEKDEEKEEYLKKINEYAKKIEHEIEIVSDSEIELIKSEEEKSLERGNKIKSLKEINLSEITKISDLKEIVKELIELL